MDQVGSIMLLYRMIRKLYNFLVLKEKNNRWANLRERMRTAACPILASRILGALVVNIGHELQDFAF